MADYACYLHNACPITALCLPEYKGVDNVNRIYERDNEDAKGAAHQRRRAETTEAVTLRGGKFLVFAGKLPNG